MLQQWIPKIPLYVTALLNFEDVGPNRFCANCQADVLDLFRCRTCLGSANHCKTCIVEIHSSQPFHQIVSWSHAHGCFLPTSLTQLGFVLDIGRGYHVSDCPSSIMLAGITVVHSHGIHDLSIKYSTCCHSPSLDLQLLAFRLFPATVTSPQTVFSFDLLELFHFHHLEGKGSAYAFMNAISRLTNDTGHFKVEVSGFFFFWLRYRL
jgi:hypothetical protein